MKRLFHSLRLFCINLTLRKNVRLNISVIVLACPHKSSRRFQHLGDHIINKPVLVPDLQLVELRLVVPLKAQNLKKRMFSFNNKAFSSFVPSLYSLFKDILEDVFKSAIVGFENSVLCAHVQGPFLANCILEAAVCKACDRLGKKLKEVMAAVPFYQR